MPRNVNDVEGPSTLDDFTGALIFLQRESIAFKLFMQLSVLAPPAVKKSSQVVKQVFYSIIMMQYPVDCIQQMIE